MDKIVRRIIRISDQLSIPTSQSVLYVSVPEQQLYRFHNGLLKDKWVISTSSNPPSCEENSNGTPEGLHRIEQKIGGDAKAGTVFFARVSTGEFFWDFDEAIQEKNLITSRIMWLKGLEEGKNSGDGVDSFRRYIYIHGTNHEDRLGEPATGGCVVLGNEDIIRLFDKVETGSLVYIDTQGELSEPSKS
ncbi:MAG: L,D-transpeptidase [Opitutales bacterium]|nr:L,D-transpeptidase [Opitutales bacterium]